MSELSSVDINWKMLTNVRPDTKMEEMFFSKSGFWLRNNWNFLNDDRLVQLERLKVSTREIERQELASQGGKDPDIDIKRPSESLAGVTQKIIKVNRTYT